MSAPQRNRKARGRIAANDNETIVVAAKVNDDTLAADALDTEAHRLAANDNETTVNKARLEAEDDGQPTGSDDSRR